jgi:hypothetical protein
MSLPYQENLFFYVSIFAGVSCGVALKGFCHLESLQRDRESPGGFILASSGTLSSWLSPKG